MNPFMGCNALLVLVLLCWSPATSAQPINSTAPGVHAATGMTFPARIGDYAKLIYSVDRGRAGSQPDLAWYYAVDTPLGGTVTVYISNLGQTEIPTGPDSPLAKAELDDGVAVVTQMLSRPLQTVKGPTECTLARLTFRCIALLDRMPNGVPVYTMLLATGYRNHVMFISAEWNGKMATLMEAEEYLDGFLSVVMQ